MRRLIVFIGSFGYSGFFPLAPATFASFIFAAIYILIPGGEKLADPYVFLLSLICSFPIASHMERIYGHDARCIVIDEIVGMQLILLNAGTGTQGVIAAFFLFRIFDVLKPFPVGLSQRLPRGFGVVADDLLAGIYTRLVLFALGFVFSGLRGFGF